MPTLREVMPKEMMDGYFEQVEKLANIEVIEEYHDRDVSWLMNKKTNVALWPGKQKNVSFWVKLSTGHKVGWNENPSTGWSFPVINPNKAERAEASARQTCGWIAAIKGE